VPDSLCRVTVGCADSDRAVDLALPSRTYVGELLPPIVDIVYGEAAGPPTGSLWHLALIGRAPLDVGMTLEQQDVRDGDHLMLVDCITPTPRWVVIDPADAIAQTCGSGCDGTAVAVAGFVGFAVVSAAVLLWSGARAGAVTAVSLAVVFAVMAAAAQRIRPRSSASVTACAGAVLHAAVAGFLAVPAGEPFAHVLLAASAASSSAALFRWLLRCGTVCLTAVIIGCAMCAGVAAIGTVWRLPTNLLGACLAVLSLGALAVAPKLAMVVTRIGPSPEADEGDPLNMVAVQRDAPVAHQTLTGIVLGSAACAVFAMLLISFEAVHSAGSPVGAVVFTAVIGLALLLRVRTHVEPARRIILATAGLFLAAMCFVVSAVSAPAYSDWVSIVAAAAAASVLCSSWDLSVHPFARRAVDIAEYLVLAAVVPAAFWVGGIYGRVRDTGLL
jgi:type VII secretion integral membrane protein EccD